jgi:GNAT superfamily N-acetyltransferase
MANAENRAGLTDAETELFGAPPKDLPKWQPPELAHGDVRVELVDLSQSRERKRFLDVADAVLSEDPNFISPLRMERMKFLDTGKNPALAALEIQAMVATRGGKLLGRITAHIDRAYNEHHGVKVGWFGFFDSIDDRAVAHALLDKAVRWVKERGGTEIIGPNNFTTNHQTGLLVENFARPATVEMTYNASYYEALVTSYGFGKAKDLLAYWIDVSPGLADPKIKRFYDVSEKVKKRYGLSIRGARLSDFEKEVALLFGLYNDTWQKNWGFVPVNEAEFRQIASDLKQIVVGDLVLIVEDRAGKPVAFSVTLPNVNEIMPKNGRLFPFAWWRLLTGMKRIKTARLFVLGVAPGHRKHGVEAMLCIETALRASRLGYSSGEIGWTLEDNLLVNRAVESFGGRLDRRYRLFGLEL